MSVIKQGSRVGRRSALPLFGGTAFAGVVRGWGFLCLGRRALHLELALGTQQPAQLQDTVVHPACHRKPKEVISEEISI